ncbi:MAG TPA: hypothetical protein VHV75_10175 [Solirubrobacteraceae bacterium]|nr:hypothetical protein [Solirubrobacteraceae bacterium]
MGLLDDAIREHLDLKRARGADPAEIERLEREALGPVRREPTFGTAQLEAPEHREPEIRGLSPEELEEYGYHDSTAPHPHPEHATQHLDLDGEHGHPEDIHFEQEPEQQPKRRFLRRTRPASLAEPAQPFEPVQPLEPAYEEPLDYGHHEPIEDHDLLEDHDLVEHPDAFEHHDPPEHDETAVHKTVQPPHLQFEQPPQRPRFSPEPPMGDEPAPPVPEPAAPAAPEPAAPAPRPDPAAEQHPENPPAHHPEPETHEQPAQHHPDPQPTREFDAQRDPENEPGEEDMLEETPEFLQDTPEHDRLWFEQRPPKDFDFDG